MGLKSKNNQVLIKVISDRV